MWATLKTDHATSTPDRRLYTLLTDHATLITDYATLIIIDHVGITLITDHNYDNYNRYCYIINRSYRLHSV